MNNGPSKEPSKKLVAAATNCDFTVIGMADSLSNYAFELLRITNVHILIKEQVIQECSWTQSSFSGLTNSQNQECLICLVRK